MLTRPSLSSLLAISVLALAAGELQGEEAETALRRPFVIGFERFARHNDISEEEAGALLISELNCTACHTSNDASLAPKRGPRLRGAGNRLRDAWVRKFIARPHELHSGTTMPDVLHGLNDLQRSEAIHAIAAYLSTQVEPFATLKAGGALPVIHEFWRKGDAQRGRELYHQVGCVSCHEPDPEFEAPSSVPSAIDALIEQLDPEELAELGLERAARRIESIPHGDLREKYSSRSLTMMLLDPVSIRPDARMPSLRLLPVDAADIATYLMRDTALDADIEHNHPIPAEIEQGRRLFQDLRCVNCHDTQDRSARRPAKPLDQLQLDAASSCLQRPHTDMPLYRLDREQLQSIMERLTNHDAIQEPTPNELVQHRMLQLNCYACHERRRAEDKEVLGGIGRYRKAYFETEGHVDLGDEGRLPPPLTDVGRKLLPVAIESVFTAKATPRRPFMTIRMPAYPHDAVSDLIGMLPMADGVDESDETSVFGDSKGIVDVGRQLVNTGCVECHAFRGESLPGAIGVDLHDIASRVHPQWFYEFLLEPGKVKPRTRMPTFFPDGQSNRNDLLDGDAHRQIAAIWHYLKKTDPLPEKIVEAMAQDFELVPMERPIILRTFMREAGNHAIAVGLPGQLNFAFDAQQVRLAMIWKGRFLDARSTWFERFAPPAEPLGENVVKFAAAPLLIINDKSKTGSNQSPVAGVKNVTFSGYRLDHAGVPTFLYRLGALEIEDRIETSDPESLQRTWTIRRPDQPSVDWKDTTILFCVHASRKLHRVSQKSVVDESNMRVSLMSEIDQNGEIVEEASLQKWWIPITNHQEQEIKVEYQW